MGSSKNIKILLFVTLSFFLVEKIFWSTYRIVFDYGSIISFYISVNNYYHITIYILGWMLNIIALISAFLIFNKKYKWAAIGLLPFLIILVITGVTVVIHWVYMFQQGDWWYSWWEFLILIMHMIFIPIYGYATFSSFYVMKNPKNNKISPSEIDPNPSDKDFLTTLIFCFFLGGWGVHRFYTGKIGTGILMIFTFAGLGIWFLIDLIMICTNSFKDVNGRKVVYQAAASNPKTINASRETATSVNNLVDDLRKLSTLKEEGIITEEEFNKKKSDLLGS